MSDSDREPTGAARAAGHAVHVVTRDARGDERVCRAALERLAADGAEDDAVPGGGGQDALVSLVLVPDAETAVALARTSRASSTDGLALVPLTSAGRGSRLLRTGTVRAAAITPRVAAALRQSTALKLDDVTVIVIAWASELLEAGEGEALDSLLADAPRESARVVVTSSLTDDVRKLIERHARRARPAGIDAPDTAAAVDVRYVETSAVMRETNLRRLLDEVDPPTAVVVAWSDESAAAAAQALGTMGYGDGMVMVSRGDVPEHVTLAVLYDLPDTPASLAAVGAATPTHLVALVTPRERPRLHALSAGTITPWVASPAVAKARARADKLRDTLRAELRDAFPAREVLALEPLLDEFDGVEIAAAALRLYERERSRASVPHALAPPRAEALRDAAPSRVSGEWTKVFLSIGNDDGVRPGDLVGAITGEAGITSSEVGKIDIRDRHSLVEVASHVAPRVIEKMVGVTIKGRRVMAREDRGPEGGSSREGPRRENRGGGDRPPRPGKTGFRDRERPGARSTSRRPDGGDRPYRGGSGTRGSGGDRPFRGGGGTRSSSDRPFRGGSRSGGDDRPFRGGGGDRPFRGGGASRGPAGRDDRDDRGDRGDRDDRGGPRGAGPGARGPRARGEHEEWSERGDRVRNARGRRHGGA